MIVPAFLLISKSQSTKKQNNKQDLLEINKFSMISPVMKRKISKVSTNQTIFNKDVLQSGETVSVQTKCPSVVFNLIEDATDQNGRKKPHKANSFVEQNNEFVHSGPRPSIFSLFSQVASRSHRPSIFSRLSDFSTASSQLFDWNYGKIFYRFLSSCSFFIILTLILIFF